MFQMQTLKQGLYSTPVIGNSKHDQNVAPSVKMRTQILRRSILLKMRLVTTLDALWISPHCTQGLPDLQNFRHQQHVRLTHARFITSFSSVK